MWIVATDAAFAFENCPVGTLVRHDPLDLLGMATSAKLGNRRCEPNVAVAPAVGLVAKGAILREGFVNEASGFDASPEIVVASQAHRGTP